MTPLGSGGIDGGEHGGRGRPGCAAAVRGERVATATRGESRRDGGMQLRRRAMRQPRPGRGEQTARGGIG